MHASLGSWQASSRNAEATPIAVPSLCVATWSFISVMGRVCWARGVRAGLLASELGAYRYAEAALS